MSNQYYIVPNRQSPAWRIFHERWMVRIRRMHLMSKTEINDIGVICSKAQGYDSYINEDAEVGLTLCELAILFNDGASFAVSTPTQVVDMYKLLLEHLEQASAAWSTGMLKVKPPKADLKIFDALANNLYAMSTQYEAKNGLAGGLTTYIHGLTGRMRTTRQNLFQLPTAETNTNSDFRYQSPITDVLANKSIKGGRQWESNKP